jgi:signal transduction histidine kinase
MLLIVLLAIVLASGTTAYWAAQRTRADQESGLHRIASTLTEAKYPLTGSVLTQVAGLSGAELVTLREDGAVDESTFRLGADDVRQLGALPLRQPSAGDGAKHSVSLAGRQYLAQRIPLRRNWASEGSSGTLCILYPEDRWSAQVQQATYPAVVTGAIAAVAAAVTTVLLSRRFVQPSLALVRRTSAIAGGDFRPASLPQRDDELRDLADSINRMAEWLGRYDVEIRRAERLHTLGKIGAGMAHQLRNAATGGRIAVELHRRACPLGDSDEPLAVALRQFGLMESFLQRFLSLGRPASDERSPLGAADLVADVLALVRPTAEHLGVRLESVATSEPLVFLADPAAARQLVSNLVLNACEAAKDARNGAPRVAVSMARVSDAWGEIRVVDNGPGPPASVEEALFEPFVTSKPDGMGLGLFVARQIAEAHGGCLRWERRAAETCFCFRFPLHRPGADNGTPSDRG